MIRRINEGFQNESFVAYYNGNLFYVGALDSDFQGSVLKILRDDDRALKSASDYLDYMGIEDFNVDDPDEVAYLLYKTMYYDAVDGEDYWNFDKFEIFPEYELNNMDESVERKSNKAKRISTNKLKESPDKYAPTGLKRGKKCYVVVDLDIQKDTPVIIGVFYNKRDAEEVAYSQTKTWRNIIQSTIY